MQPKIITKANQYSKAQDSDSPVQHKQQQVSPYAASYIPGSYDGPQGSPLLNLLNTSQRTPTGSTLLCVLPMSSANGNSQRSGSGMLFSPAVIYNADAWAGNQKPTHIVGSQGRPDILATVPDRPDAPTSETGQSKNTSMPVTDADRKFTCPVCEKFRSHASDLEHHLRRRMYPPPRILGPNTLLTSYVYVAKDSSEMIS